MNEMISIIIPVYNSEKYIEKCIESVLRNTVQNYELILIDDGSSDHSGKICDTYALKDDRIRVFHGENQGVSAARNKGIDNAKGKYITFIDSDDYIGLFYLEKLYRGMEEKDVELTISTMDSAQNEMLGLTHTRKSFYVNMLSQNAEDAQKYLMLNKAFLVYGPMCKLYKRDIIKKEKIYFPRGIHYGEDVLFNMQYLKYCNNIAVVEGGEYKYRRENQNSLSQMYRPDMFETGIKINDSIRESFVYRGFLNAETEEYIAWRIFDDAYNAILSCWNIKCRMSLKEKYEKIKKIVNSNKMKDFFTIINDNTNYSKVVWKLMQKRKALFLTIYCQIGVWRTKKCL